MSPQEPYWQQWRDTHFSLKVFPHQMFFFYVNYSLRKYISCCSGMSIFMHNVYIMLHYSNTYFLDRVWIFWTFALQTNTTTITLPVRNGHQVSPATTTMADKVLVCCAPSSAWQMRWRLSSRRHMAVGPLAVPKTWPVRTLPLICFWMLWMFWMLICFKMLIGAFCIFPFICFASGASRAYNCRPRFRCRHKKQNDVRYEPGSVTTLSDSYRNICPWPHFRMHKDKSTCNLKPCMSAPDGLNR